jgi:GNAT superfamily N-acetyltransferase
MLAPGRYWAAWREQAVAETINTSTPGLTLRFAQPADTGLILEFVRELADYERLSHEVTADVATLREALFGARPVPEVVIAQFEGSPAGFALFFSNFSTVVGKPGLYLEDLFVRPAFRRRGIGQVLLTFLAALAEQRGCGRLEWAVLDWNKPAIDFYKTLGATPMDEWTVFRVTGPALRELAAGHDRAAAAK